MAVSTDQIYVRQDGTICKGKKRPH